MKNLRHEKAITLIALVITIILLLILVGIVLQLTLGEYGILNKTKETTIAYKEQEAREKLELVLLDLQTDKVIDKKYNENEYIDAKIRDNNMEIGGDIVFVDGWKFEIDRSVPQIGENLGQGKVNITVEAEASYIGTSSTTINVTATSTKGNIVEYQYKLNGEVKEITEQSTYTIENLEPATTYKILVIAIDELGNRSSSKMFTIATKQRTYIIKDGIQQMQGQTKNATISQEEGYINLVCSTTYDRAGILYNYDFTNYKKAKIDTAIIKKDQAETNCQISLSQFNNSSNEDWSTYEIIASNHETVKPRKTYELDIGEFKGNHIIAYLKNATNPATAATMHIYNLWLEE